MKRMEVCKGLIWNPGYVVCICVPNGVECDISCTCPMHFIGHNPEPDIEDGDLEWFNNTEEDLANYHDDVQ